ncbi:MAG TPA: flavin reductase family protein [Dehalococcoidia bacterium]
MDGEARHRVLEQFTYGVYAVTARDPAGRTAAFTASWVTQCSFQPPMVAVAVENGTDPMAALQPGATFAVNVLAAGQEEVARTLARRDDPQKAGRVAYGQGSTGCPVLRDALGWVECRVTGSTPTGDHTLFLGEVLDAGAGGSGRPLTAAESGLRYAG